MNDRLAMIGKGYDHFAVSLGKVRLSRLAVCSYAQGKLIVYVRWINSIADPAAVDAFREERRAALGARTASA